MRIGWVAVDRGGSLTYVHVKGQRAPLLALESVAPGPANRKQTQPRFDASMPSIKRRTSRLILPDHAGDAPHASDSSSVLNSSAGPRCI